MLYGCAPEEVMILGLEMVVCADEAGVETSLRICLGVVGTTWLDATGG